MVIDRWMDFWYEEGINDGKFIVVGILTYYFCVADQLVPCKMLVVVNDQHVVWGRRRKAVWKKRLEIVVVVMPI